MTYPGQFATNCGICSFGAANASSLGRSRHFARSPVTSLQVAFPNWYINWSGATFTEAGTGGIMTLTAGIENSAGNASLGQFLWSGIPAATVADGATSALSDPLSVSLAAGDSFFIRSFYTTTNAFVICDTGTGVGAAVTGADASNGEQWRVNTTDQTTGFGSLTGGALGTGLCYRPCLLVATLADDTKSFLFIGDSRAYGFRDVYTSTSSDKGQLSRAVGTSFGYTNCGIPSDKASLFLTSHARRLAFAQYFSHVICEYGFNDLNGGDTAAQTAASLASTYALFSIPVYQSTINCNTTSTDSWATTANQTIPGVNASRVTLNNTYIRAVNIAGMTGYLEVADVLESARDSGKWAINGTANWYTDDGTHETNTANLAIQTAALPSAPTIGTATATGSTTATVAFTASASPGLAAITSYVATASPGGLTTSGASSPIAFTGLTTGTNYTFTVKAQNLLGNSSASSASNQITTFAVPGAPTIGTAVAGNTSAQVPFTAPASDGGSAITSYLATSTPGSLTGSINQAGSGTVTVNGLTNGVSYTFKVHAVNPIGAGADSAASNSVTPTSPNPIPHVIITLNNAANLSNLKGAWFDQITPDLFQTPTDVSTTLSTNASGVLDWHLTFTAKSGGATGWLVLSNSDGTVNGTDKKFSGPVVLT